MKYKFPRGTQIVECKNIEFCGKDIIEVENFEDFIWLLGGSSTVFKMSNRYYSISSEVAYFIKVKDD